MSGDARKVFDLGTRETGLERWDLDKKSWMASGRREELRLECLRPINFSKLECAVANSRETLSVLSRPPSGNFPELLGYYFTNFLCFNDSSAVFSQPTRDGSGVWLMGCGGLF